MDNVLIISSPIVLDALTCLRDKSTSLDNFRKCSDQITKILLGNSLDGISLTRKAIQTPIEKIESEVISEDILIVPILRAGVAMLGPSLELIPSAKVGFVGLERDEETALAREYYWKMPQTTTESMILIIDPMLATGGSVISVLTKLHVLPHKEIRIVSVITAPEGIEIVQNEFPDVKIITAAVDKGLNAQKYIIPGLGDYGDRYFGTE